MRPRGKMSGVSGLCIWAGLALTAVSALVISANAGASPDPDEPRYETRIDALLKRMTIEEKAGQVNEGGFLPAGMTVESVIASKTGIGHWVQGCAPGVTSEQAAGRANELQKLALEKTRLSIPLLICNDCILDARVADAVTFPNQMGMGSTWDPGLVKSIYGVISEECRAVGYARTLTPNLGVARDPRFGRAGECYSEDPYLVSRMATESVEGLQGDSLETGVLATAKHFAAYDATAGGRDSSAMDVSERTLREVFLPPFAAAVRAGVGSIMCAYHAINGVPTCTNKWLLTDILKNEWGFDGFVATDYKCIETLYTRPSDLRYGPYNTVGSFDEAVKLAYESGVDVHDHDTTADFADRLAGLVRKGYIPESVLDNAVKRTLRAKFRLGLFENPYVDPERSKEIVGCEAHRKVALQAARECIVLLANDGNLLPLKKNVASIAVIGPNADSITNQLGYWTKDVVPPYDAAVTTVLGGIKGAVPPQTKVRYARGCDVQSDFQPLASGCRLIADAGSEQGLKAEYFDNRELSGTPVLVRTDRDVYFDWGDGAPAQGMQPGKFSVRWTGRIAPHGTGSYRLGMDIKGHAEIFIDGDKVLDIKTDTDRRWRTANVYLNARRMHDIRIDYASDGAWAMARAKIDHASAAAGIAGAVEAAKESDVAVVVVGDSPSLSGEFNDRADLDLTGSQEDLVKAVYATGVPTVVVLINNRPLTINWIADNIPAVVEAWNPGQEGGKAIADVLFGDYNPGGKLPITFPRSLGQLPVCYDREPGWHCNRYVDGTPTTPLYPFGYGLSYTRFEYSNLRLSSPTIGPTGKVDVSVDVKNAGDVAGDEIVQMYIHRTNTSVVRPVKELKGFERITLKPGEKKTVTLTLDADKLAFYNRDMKRVVEPGDVDVMVGGSSADLISIRLRVAPGVAGIRRPATTLPQCR